MYLYCEYTFEIILPKDQLKYLDYLINNFNLIKDKYSFKYNCKGSSNYNKNVSVINEPWKNIHKLYKDKLIVYGEDNNPPNCYLACLQETLRHFDNEKEFVFHYSMFSDRLYKVKLSKDYCIEEDISENLIFE